MRLSLLLALLAAVPAASGQSLPTWAEPSSPTPASSDPAPVEAIGGPGFYVLDDGAVPDDPTLVPVDGGLGLLALAGGAYAAARLRRRDS